MAEGLSEKQQNALVQMFAQLDKSGSGTATVKEVGKYFTNVLRVEDDEKFQKHLTTFCADITGVDNGLGFTYEEFAAIMTPVLTSASEEELNKLAFDALDIKKTGELTVEQMLPVFQGLGGGKGAKKFSETELQRMLDISGHETNGKRSVNKEEFLKMAAGWE